MNHLVESLEQRTHLTVTLDPVADQTYPANKAILVPITGATDSTNPASFVVSTSDARVTARVLTNVTFLRMQISIGGVDKGELQFALFGDLAPKTVARITQLVNSHFYDNLIFHRIIPGFMAQGGDPNGTGTGGSGVKIDDEFSTDAIFARPGMLAMANSNNGSTTDTGDSQFFVTVAETRWLDFRHTIFGELIRGQNVLDQMMAAGSADGTPSQTVRITSATIVQKLADAVVVAKGPQNVPASVTVTTTDHNSNASRTFAVNGVADTTDDPPFLNPVPASLQTNYGTAIHLTLSATEIDAGSPNFGAIALDNSKLSVTLGTDHVVTVSAINSFTGTTQILVGVLQSSGNWDTQKISVTVLPGPFATYDSATRTLRIHGTSDPNALAITVSGATLSVTLDSSTLDFGLSAIDKVEADLYGGNDSVNASTLPIPLIVRGGDGNDTITGGLGADSINGDNGDDVLIGGDSADTIFGNFGNDSITGGLRVDSLLGGLGNDTIGGGDGPDRIFGGDGTDVLRGGKGADYLEGRGKADTIFGGDGNDTVFGGAGADSILGEIGDDWIDVGVSTIFHDTVNGGDGADSALYDGDDLISNVETPLA